MEREDALFALAALGQATRLEAFRLLVRQEPEGLGAGVLAAQLDVPQNTLSAHLSVLARAGLVHGERRGRAVNYRASLARMGALAAYLTQDCCGGRPEACAGTVATTACDSPSTQPSKELAS